MIYPIKHLPPVIPVGVQTESGVESIGFDVKPWMDEFDGLSFSVWVTRADDASAYPAADVELVGTILYWQPNVVDTAVAGAGKVEILAITGDKRKLSGWCGTMVKATSLAATQETPEAARPWVDEVLEAADEAKRQADRAEEIANDLAGGGFTGAVRFDKPQDLTEEQKEQARENIGATVGEEGPPGPPGDTRVYVGSDTPPEGAEVWINPQGVVKEDEIPGVKVEETDEGVMITAINWDGITQALVKHGKDAEGGSASVDDTLTVSGAAADAKVTGDKFKALTEEIAKLPQDGGIELTSPNGTRYRFTVSDDGTLTAKVVTV